MRQFLCALLLLIAFTATATPQQPRTALRPNQTGPITIRMNQTARQAFETLAELAGIQVVFHRQFQNSTVFAFNVENVSILDALDILSFETGNFWQVRDPKTIIVATDNQTVRRDIEPMVMKTFYLGNITKQQDITELVTMLRTTLSINQVTILSPLNAITVRDTADKIALVEQLLGVAPPPPLNTPTTTITALAAGGRDAAINVFIIDGAHVRQISPDGASRSVDDLYAAGIAVDTAGNLYIAEDTRNQIRKRTPDGTISTIAGNGKAGFKGDGGPAISAQISAPKKIAVDREGTVYFADSGNGRIRKVDASGIIKTVVGNGVWGFTGDGGPGTAARIETVTGMTVDGQGNLYFSEGRSRIRKLTPQGTVATLQGATGMAIGTLAADEGGVVYVADGKLIRMIPPSGRTGTIAIDARAIAAGPSGILYVVETNGRILEIGKNGKIVR